MSLIHPLRAGSARRRAALATGVVVAALALAGCAEPALEVGETSVKADEAGEAAGTGPSMSVTVTGAPTPLVDAELEQSFLAVGAFQLQLPLGWAKLDGMDGAASGATSTASGAATYTAVPALAKDQATWVADFVAGSTDVIEAKDGVTQQAAVTTTGGLELFHLVQNYADNRAHIFGFVADHTLHLLRFGLDGTAETAAAVLKAARTAWYSPVAAPDPASAGTPSTGEATPYPTVLSTPAAP